MADASALGDGPAGIAGLRAGRTGSGTVGPVRSRQVATGHAERASDPDVASPTSDGGTIFRRRRQSSSDDGGIPRRRGWSPSDEATVTTSRSHRDPDALYRAVAPAVLGYLRAQGVTDPEDLLMDVFVTVVRDLDGVSGDDDAVRRWVFSIAHHRVIDQRRWQARRTRLDRAELDRLTGTAEAADSPTALGPDPQLVAALARLTDDQRAVLGLRLVADLPIDDVARILHKRPDAIKALQRRATERLAKLLGPAGG